MSRGDGLRDGDETEPERWLGNPVEMPPVFTPLTWIGMTAELLGGSPDMPIVRNCCW